MTTSSNRVKTVSGHPLDDHRIALLGEPRLPGEVDEVPGAAHLGLEVEKVVGVRWDDVRDAPATRSRHCVSCRIFAGLSVMRRTERIARLLSMCAAIA